MSEDLATEALLEFLNAVEAGIAAAKRVISEAKGIEKWDPAKIRWEQAQGTYGIYERSEDVNNLEFKAMLKDLIAHQGKLTREGFFYWIFKYGNVVGRKKRAKTAEAKPEAGSDPAQFFPDALRSLLSFEKQADTIIIRPRQFLGAENFAKIAGVVKQHNGEYVSAGKGSHFRIPTKP